MTITIKTPDESNRQAWESLYRGYAAFYNMPIADTTLDTVWGWIQSGTCLQGRIAIDATGKAVGLMHFRAMPSPLRGTEVGFLDDLFVDPEHRGSGVVNAMLASLTKEALSRKWPFVRWITKENNYRARRFYDLNSIKTDWVTYQMDV